MKNPRRDPLHTVITVIIKLVDWRRLDEFSMLRTSALSLHTSPP